MIVLDTNVLSELMRSAVDPTLRSWLDRQDREVFAITAITVMEITHGLARLPAGKRRTDLQQRFEVLIAEDGGLPVFNLDAESARLAGAFQARRDNRGRPSGQADMMIAGICFQHQAILATRNRRDFDGLGIEIVDPFVPV